MRQAKHKIIRPFDVAGIKTFNDVPQYIESTSSLWSAHYDWKSMGQWWDENTAREEGIIIELEPDFQRGHVWTEHQQISYVEHCLRGGSTGRVVYFNQKGSLHDSRVPYVLVDGLQRMTAVRKFMCSELKVFGGLTCDGMIQSSKFKKFPTQAQFFHIHVNNLQNDADVLAWYLEMNGGGTPHTQEELDRVYKLYLKAQKATKSM